MTLSTKPASNDLCWIHIKDVSAFLRLGANADEQRVGQNIKLDLSLQIPYRGTNDKLQNTMDYGLVIVRVQQAIESSKPINLLETLAENLLDLIGQEFNEIFAARIVVQKGFVPIPHFSGTVAIEAERRYRGN